MYPCEIAKTFFNTNSNQQSHMKNTQNLISDRFLLEKDMEAFLEERILKTAPHVPVEENISPEEFEEKYVKANKPVILRGLVDKWPALEKWDFDFFAREHGEVAVNTNLYDAKHIKASNLNDLVKEIKNPTLDYAVYLQEWWFQNSCPDLLKDIIVPKNFAKDQNLKLLGFYNSTLWIGAKGAFTPVHQDTVYANIWTVQIKGKKEWILFDKNAVLKSDKNGNRDFDEFLANKDNHVMYCYLQKGDVLYVPYKWWHRARTLENAISLNTFFITDEIVQRYIRDVFSIPMAVALNKELLQKHDPMRYNICMGRINILSELLGYNKENVLNVKVS